MLIYNTYEELKLPNMSTNTNGLSGIYNTYEELKPGRLLSHLWSLLLDL